MLRFSLAGILLACTLAASAGAGTIVVRLNLLPGKLTLQAKQRALAKGTSSLKLNVADGRRSGAGWTLRFARGTGVTVIGDHRTLRRSFDVHAPDRSRSPVGQGRAARRQGNRHGQHRASS